MLRLAAERSYEIIGEASRQCQIHFAGSLDPMGTIQRVIAFRNELAHRYGDIDDEIAWKITRNYLPTLMAEIEVLMEGLS